MLTEYFYLYISAPNLINLLYKLFLFLRALFYFAHNVTRFYYSSVLNLLFVSRRTHLIL